MQVWLKSIKKYVIYETKQTYVLIEYLSEMTKEKEKEKEEEEEKKTTHA